jgi:hypothetical protein
MTTVEELIAPLPEDARFEAYYFDFEPTGIGPVDAILSAVAVAGKGSHHTQSWGEESDAYLVRPGLVPGESAVDLIQKNAERSAEIIRLLLEEIAGREATLELVRIHVQHEFVDGHESPVDLQEVMAAPPRDVLAGFEIKVTESVHASTRERAARLIAAFSRHEAYALDDLVESVRALEVPTADPALAGRAAEVHDFNGSMPASLVKRVTAELTRITQAQPALASIPEGTPHD